MQRILVVDDQPTVACLLQAALRDLRDCEIAVAASGEQALRLLNQPLFDLLITDYRLPGMDGIVLAGQMRVFHPRTETVMITAFVDHALSRRGAEGGVQQVVHKPVKSGRLRALAARPRGVDPKTEAAAVPSEAYPTVSGTRKLGERRKQ